LHYPRRIGTEKDWLSEAEVAEAYRARFAGLADRLAQVTQVEAGLLPRLDPGEIFAVVTLVPDLPGPMTIDTAAFDTFRLGNANRQFGAFGIPMRSFMVSTVRRRRLVATSSPSINERSKGACELHEDGSGVFATTIESPTRDNIQRQEKLVDNNWLVLGIATALRRLGHHARDTAAAGGLASVQATVWTGGSWPMALVSNVGWPNEQVGQGLIHGPASADAVADLDDLATDGQAWSQPPTGSPTGSSRSLGPRRRRSLPVKAASASGTGISPRTRTSATGRKVQASTSSPTP
jgi:hypothetical protein